MSSFLVGFGAIGIILSIMGMIVLGVMFAQVRQWGGAVGSLVGIAVVASAAYAGNIYAQGWWDR